jgi:succinoglycan biosynthesis transport protein ExoP
LRSIVRNASFIWEVVDHPFSRFAEAMRSIKSAADLSGPEKKATKTIGFTSSLPGEGKSTISAAFALLTARTGARTILIDGDLRNPALSASLAPRAEHGILDVVLGKKPIEEVLWKDPETGLVLLPGSTGPRIAHSSEVLGSPAVRTLLEELRQKFEYVIVDLPPVAPIVDVQSTAGLVDYYVFITEWARTKIEVAQLALKKASVVHDNLLGVILNKVDFKRLGRYERRLSDYYSDEHYAQYGERRPG